MCSVFGAIVRPGDDAARTAVDILHSIIKKSSERGRDGFGVCNSAGYGLRYVDLPARVQLPVKPQSLSTAWIGNFRAEPTTEYVQDKTLTDQQPYQLQYWSMVHNGTIANDADLRTGDYPSAIDSAAIVEQLDVRGCIPGRGSYLQGKVALQDFEEVIKELKGSYAVLAYAHYRPDLMMVATNYRPIWYIVTDVGIFFASSRSYFPSGYTPTMVPPYTVSAYGAEGLVEQRSLRPRLSQHRILAVCSGGLDSVVAAHALAYQYPDADVHLLHFRYGSRAEGPEVDAVTAVAQAMGWGLTLFPLPVYDKKDSPLLDADSALAGGEQGAEFAHEWVPARNLLLLSVATAYAEANKFDIVALGNNMEEAGAYPDNEPEFIHKFNDLLPFAVGDGKQVRVVMPVGDLMKHEIVRLGNQLGSPLHLTWSCYKAGKLHCGKCGPCFMRKTAFKINNLPEVIEYEDSHV